MAIPTVTRGSNPYIASGFGSADSQPASPVEKFFTLKQHYLTKGKEWNWQVMRDMVLHEYVEDKRWPADHYLIRALASITDEDAEMSPERARLVRMDDREAKAELERRRLLDEQKRREIDEGSGNYQADDIAELKAQIAALTAALKQGNPAVAEVVAEAVETSEDVETQGKDAVAEAEKIASGQPTLANTRAELIRYADKNNLGLPERLRANHIAKTEILEYILEAQQPKDV